MHVVSREVVGRSVVGKYATGTTAVAYVPGMWYVCRRPRFDALTLLTVDLLAPLRYSLSYSYCCRMSKPKEQKRH